MGEFGNFLPWSLFTKNGDVAKSGKCRRSIHTGSDIGRGMPTASQQGTEASSRHLAEKPVLAFPPNDDSFSSLLT